MGAISAPATSARADLRAPNAGDSDRSRRAAHPTDIGPGGRTRIIGGALPASELKGGGTSLIGIRPLVTTSPRGGQQTRLRPARLASKRRSSARLMRSVEVLSDSSSVATPTLMVTQI